MLRILNQRLVACEDRLSDLLRKEVPARLASLTLDFSEHQGVGMPLLAACRIRGY